MNRKSSKRIKNILQFMGFGLPATFIWITVVIIPFIYGIWITFTEKDGKNGRPKRSVH